MWLRAGAELRRMTAEGDNSSTAYCLALNVCQLVGAVMGLQARLPVAALIAPADPLPALGRVSIRGAA